MASGIIKSVIDFFKKLGGFFVELFKRIIKVAVSIVSTVFKLYETIIDYIIDGVVEVWCIVFARVENGKITISPEFSELFTELQKDAGVATIDFEQEGLVLCRNTKTGEILESSVQAINIKEISSLGDSVLEAARNTNGACRIASKKTVDPIFD